VVVRSNEQLGIVASLARQKHGIKPLDGAAQVMAEKLLSAIRP